MNRTAQTRDRIQHAAIDLFEAQGFAATSVSEVAERAGVSEMTVYRHFSTKAALAIDDPFDPRIVDAVAAQPRQLPPIVRVMDALTLALRHLEVADDEFAARRARIVATTPELIGPIAENNLVTQNLIAEQLVADGADAVQSHVAAAAVLAAITAALTRTVDDAPQLAQTVGGALDTLRAAR